MTPEDIQKLLYYQDMRHFFTPLQLRQFKERRDEIHSSHFITLPSDSKIDRRSLLSIGRISTSLSNLFLKQNTEQCPKCKSGYHMVRKRKEYRGCCTNCGSQNGFYFENCLTGLSAKEHETQLKNIKKAFGFTRSRGFFEDGVGCCLPRARRSITCLRYTCNDELRRISHGLVEGIFYIRTSLGILA